MKRLVLLSLTSAVLLTSSASAQVRFEGPQFGYLFDEVSRSVRGLSGVPGAAALEDSMPAGFSVDRAVISRLGFALVETKGGGVVHKLTAAGAREIAAADLWAVSPSGAKGAFYSRATGRVAVWDVGGDEFSLTREHDAPALKAVAIADDGTVAGIAGSSVVEIAASGARAIASGGQLTALAYFPGSRDLAAADAAGRVIVSRGGAAVEREAAARGALAISRDGQRVIVAEGDGVWIWNLEQQSEARVSCGCAVSEIRSVGRADVFHLASDGENPVLLDLTSGEPRIARLPVTAIRAAAANDGGVK